MEQMHIFIALLVILITAVLFFIYQRRKSVRKGIILTGLCDSGKTLLYARLMHRKFVATQTSIKENIGDYYINNDYLQIIDIPGHERLRDKFFENYKSQSKGIIYVIDSSTFQKDIRDVAEFLYNILCDEIIVAKPPSILILCNKQDMPFVKNSNAIKAMLEKELNTLRITKASQLESVDPNAQRKNILGDTSEPFTFGSLNHYKINFIDAFATDKKQDCNISELEKWLTKLV